MRSWLEVPNLDERLDRIEKDIAVLMGSGVDLFARNEVKKLKIEVNDLKNELFGAGVSER